VPTASAARSQLVALTLFALLGCELPSAKSDRAHAAASKSSPPQVLVLTGSSTVAPLATELAERFEQTHPGVKIDVQTGGSSRGVADARSGVAQIGMVSRALKPNEQDLKAFALARDGVAVIVNRGNPLEALTSAQVVALYRGEATRWDEITPRYKGSAVIVHKAEGRSTGELFLEHFKLKPSEVKPSVIIGDNEQGIKTVAGNPAAIGYVSIGAAEHAIAGGVPIKLVPVDGLAPSRDAVREGRFPISRPLQFVTRGAPTGVAREFIQFAQSPSVHDLIAKHSFIPASS
jgi:phosphate transport system substrate-binding protein